LRKEPKKISSVVFTECLQNNYIIIGMLAKMLKGIFDFFLYRTRGGKFRLAVLLLYFWFSHISIKMHLWLSAFFFHLKIHAYIIHSKSLLKSTLIKSTYKEGQKKEKIRTPVPHIIQERRFLKSSTIIVV